MVVEARSLAHLQLAEKLPACPTNTLHSDGTTKFGHKYGGFQVTSMDSSYTLCISDMKAGGANDFKELLEQALSDINAVCNTIENCDASPSKAKEILASIKNTMSDRHIVEKNFNDLLDTYRADILPDVVDGWNGLSPTERASFSKMNNFFCGLHFLVALADISAETLRQWESLHSEDVSAGESGTIRLIRTACKAIQKQCSEQAGCHVMFHAYVRTQGVSLFPIAKFKGNGFNIVFYNAGGVFFLRHHLLCYLENVCHTRNKLLEAVHKDLKHPLYLIDCRALGIVSKCITASLWRILESPLPMSKLGKEYQRMYRCFLKWSGDASTLLTEGLGSIDEDDVYRELMNPTSDESQDLLLELLQMICSSFVTVSDRLLGDHLEGGIHSEVSSQELDSDTGCVPKTNARSERDFAILDR